MSLPPPFDASRGAVHFMGVAGAGMAPLAELFFRSGLPVTGCDLQPWPGARALASLGCQVHEGHHPEHVDQASALVVTAAVPWDHPEIQRARAMGIPVLKRAEALGTWVNRGRVVAVAGSHGKTTTTAMTTEILAAAEMDPTGLVGGRVLAWESNLRFGAGPHFVVEADEFDRSFHHLRPQVAVVTSVEADHLDVFQDLEGVQEAFTVFLEGVSPDGQVAICGDDHGASRLLPALGGRATTYGLNPGAQLRGEVIREVGSGATFSVWEEGSYRGEIALGVPGRGNVQNALGAALGARMAGAEWEPIRRGLEAFQGVGRRFELLGEVGGVTVVDDYAHHPTEIRATLAAARSRFPGGRIVAVFQPHLFSRTKDFAREFGEALSGADEVWVTEIYPAREKPIPGVTGVLVAQAAVEAGAPSVSFHPQMLELPSEMLPGLRAGDVCLTMGAGSIELLGGDILGALRRRLGDPEREGVTP
jgi:UDP-N-acetylmuramate--alanine ligase